MAAVGVRSYPRSARNRLGVSSASHVEIRRFLAVQGAFYGVSGRRGEQRGER